MAIERNAGGDASLKQDVIVDSSPASTSRTVHSRSDSSSAVRASETPRSWSCCTRCRSLSFQTLRRDCLPSEHRLLLVQKTKSMNAFDTFTVRGVGGCGWLRSKHYLSPSQFIRSPVGARSAVLAQSFVPAAWWRKPRENSNLVSYSSSIF